MRRLLWYCLFVAACNPKAPVINQHPYFNLTKALRDQIQDLYKSHASYVKYVEYNGKTDQNESRKPDWNKELDPLFEADISAPAMQGLYKTDSMRNTDSTLIIRYTATAEDLPVRNLSVRLDRDNNLIGFDADVRTGSMLNDTRRALSYIRNKEYRVKSTTHNKFLSDDMYSIKGNIYLQDTYFE